DGCPSLDASLLTPFSRRMLRAIREVDDVHMVWYEPWVLFDGGAATHVGPLDDPRGGFAFQDYDTGHYDRPLGNAVRRVQRQGDALRMAELGATQDPAVVLEVMNGTDRAMGSPVYWAYANNAPFPIAGGVGVASARQQGLGYDLSEPLSGANLDTPVWDALV